jgi:hypothetical protein
MAVEEIGVSILTPSAFDPLLSISSSPSIQLYLSQANTDYFFRLLSLKILKY